MNKIKFRLIRLKRFVPSPNWSLMSEIGGLEEATSCSVGELC